MPSPGRPARSRSDRAHPVLAGLLIEAGSFDEGAGTGEGLQLSTFDYETSARATLNADVSEEGRALVSGRLLADICRSLPNKPVDMAIDGPKVTLTCGSARFSLQTMPVEDYPTLPQMPEARGTVPQRGCSRTRSPRRSPPPGATTCCRCSPVSASSSTATSIAMLATDRFRLSQRELDLVAPGSGHRRGRPGAGEGAGRHRQGADRRHRDLDRPVLPGSGGQPARASSASRARPAAASVVRRHGCSTATSPRCARCSRAST